MKPYHKMVILLLFLACITVSVSAEMSREQVACEARGGWYSDVYSDGTVVTTPFLDNGRMYSITAGEIYQVDEDQDIQADAQFLQGVEDLARKAKQLKPPKRKARIAKS